MTQRFAGKIAVVTGAGGGIGSAIARRLAAEGAHVVVCDVLPGPVEEVAREIRWAGGRANTAVFDLGDPSAATGAIDEVVRDLGRIDILANNAGIIRRGDILAISEQDWMASFAINVHAMFFICRAVLPHMQAQGSGAIVNTASQWGLHPAPGHIAYNATKAAVVSMTQSLARDFAGQHIRVNCVCPGEINTAMSRAGLARSGRTPEDLAPVIPFGRMGKPEEVAALVAFLASDDAPFVTGSAVEITGAQAVS